MCIAVKLRTKLEQMYSRSRESEHAVLYCLNSATCRVRVEFAGDLQPEQEFFQLLYNVHTFCFNIIGFNKILKIYIVCSDGYKTAISLAITKIIVI